MKTRAFHWWSMCLALYAWGCPYQHWWAAATVIVCTFVAGWMTLDIMHDPDPDGTLTQTQTDGHAMVAYADAIYTHHEQREGDYA